MEPMEPIEPIEPEADGADEADGAHGADEADGADEALPSKRAQKKHIAYRHKPGCICAHCITKHGRNHAAIYNVICNQRFQILNDRRRNRFTHELPVIAMQVQPLFTRKNHVSCYSFIPKTRPMHCSCSRYQALCGKPACIYTHMVAEHGNNYAAMSTLRSCCGL